MHAALSLNCSRLLFASPTIANCRIDCANSALPPNFTRLLLSALMINTTAFINNESLTDNASFPQAAIRQQSNPTNLTSSNNN